MLIAHNLDYLPRCFLRVSRLGTPFWGVLVAFCFGLLGFLSVSNGSDQAFIWLSNLSGKLLISALFLGLLTIFES